jgi:hypothetical protein
MPSLGYDATAPSIVRVLTPGRGIDHDGRTLARWFQDGNLLWRSWLRGGLVNLVAGGVNQFMEPQFELDEDHANYAAGLQSGMRISLVCTGCGDMAKTPMSKDCVPAN